MTRNRFPACIAAVAGVLLAGSAVVAAPAIVRLHGLNFSPYVGDQDPNHGVPISARQIEARIRRIAPFTTWVRTFGAADGLEQTGAIAKAHGLKVAAGAWLGAATTTAGRLANETQIANLVAMANRGEADMVIVGSETLLRRDLSPAALVAHLQAVRTAVPGHIPVTTADVYAELLAHPEVAAVCDLIMANLYPYWEGINVRWAAARMDGVLDELQAAWPDKPIVISETGWPSAGDRLGDALPTAVNAAYFLMNAVTWAEARGVPVFHFAAFDEAWKAAHEGPQGAHWGIWDAKGKLKQHMQGVFRGERTGDTWSFATGPGVRITAVAPYGASGYVHGQVSGVAPSRHRIAVLIQVSGGWWTKPTFGQPLTPILPDGRFSADIATGGIDHLATLVAVFLVPAGVDVPLASGSAEVPPALRSAALAEAIIDRRTFVAPPPLLGMTVEKMSLSLRLAGKTQDRDAVRFSGMLAVPDGFAPAGAALTIRLGGVAWDFGALSPKGAARCSDGAGGSGTFALKSRDGVWLFSASLGKPSQDGSWAEHGFTGADTPSTGQPADMPVEIRLGTSTWGTTVPMVHRASAGKTGKAVLNR